MLRNFFATHKTINHSAGEYVKDNAHTNTIEGFWGLFKRGIYGVYHNISKKYLQNYINEFAFRYNHRNKNRASGFGDIANNTFDTLIAKTVLKDADFGLSF